MKKNSLISIIMSVYNAGDFLALALQSLINQTYDNWELIVIDDASSDNSWQILKQFSKQDRRIKIFRNQQNKGIGFSLNRALDKCQGEFIARMDADDIAYPKRLEVQVNFLQKHKDIVACGGQAVMIDGENKIFARKNFPTNPEFLYQMIMKMIPLQHPILMARADIYKKYRYMENLPTAEDVDLLFYLLSKGKISNVSQTIYKYRKADTSNGYHNVKKTFYLTFLQRIKAIYKYGYRPTLSGLVISFLQLITVTFLPSKWIVRIFEAMRFYPPFYEAFVARLAKTNLAVCQ